jgi:hypothetical protein
MLARCDGKIFSYIGIVFLELGERAFIGEIEVVRVCPVLLKNIGALNRRDLPKLLVIRFCFTSRMPISGQFF